MKRTNALAAVTLVTVLALAAVGVTGATTQRNPFKLPAGSFLVRGDVAHPLVLEASDLAALPSHTIQVSFQSATGVQQHTETGPLLADVLALAKPVFDPAMKNDQLRHYVAATGSDGYQAIVAWGEFDPGFEGKQILLSINEDGQSLAAVGPRLVVPGDVRGGRYVSNVVELRLAAARTP
jgi:hypothetical protein